MNIQGFYEYVILRDILAFILPGGISLAGIYMVARSLGSDRWEKSLPFLSNLNPFLEIVFLLLISFLVGHIWDMAYRLIFQTKKPFQRIKAIKKILMGDKMSNAKSADNHIANEIRTSVGQFLNIDWDKTPIEQWIKSGKAYEASVLLSYWIEEEDPKLFGTEIGRPIVQSHLLHVCGLSFGFLGIFCIPGIAIVYWLGLNPLQEFDPLTLGILFVSSLLFGLLLIRQGIHKRDIIVEHAFRVFYVVWQKRILEQKASWKKEQHNRYLYKRNRA
jgi:hypothetical protein